MLETWSLKNVIFLGKVSPQRDGLPVSESHYQTKLLQLAQKTGDVYRPSETPYLVHLHAVGSDGKEGPISSTRT